MIGTSAELDRMVSQITKYVNTLKVIIYTSRHSFWILLIASKYNDIIYFILKNLYNFSATKGKNYWDGRGQSLRVEVLCLIKEDEGDRDNAHFCEKAAGYILSHVYLLPLITFSHRDAFGYGRVTATSAPVESNINYEKNRLFKNKDLPMRVDDAVRFLIEYAMGKCKLLDAADAERKQESQQLNTTDYDYQADQLLQKHDLTNVVSSDTSLCPRS